MYRCLDCEETFECPRHDKEKLGEYYDDVEVCPYCYGLIEEVKKCECGEWISLTDERCNRCEDALQGLCQGYWEQAYKSLASDMDMTYEEAREHLIDFIEGA